MHKAFLEHNPAILSQFIQGVPSQYELIIPLLPYEPYYSIALEQENSTPKKAQLIYAVYTRTGKSDYDANGMLVEWYEYQGVRIA